MRAETPLILPLLAAALLFAGCTGEQASEDRKGDNGTEASPPQADAEFTVKFETSKGDVLIKVHPGWSPIGAAHFKELVQNGYFDGNRFFRVVPNFVVQFGLNGDPTVTRQHTLRRLKDDPVMTTNARGTVVYATAGPNTRTTQLFINLVNNARLDGDGFSPFGEVIQGMEVVDAINAEYGQSPDQGRITDEGNAYLESYFPRLDYIRQATIVP
jgi:peptidyl-prolyl cis-trans isomerase A (cyclophilin A)